MKTYRLPRLGYLGVGLVALLSATVASTAVAATFNVNPTAVGPDAAPGDGLCATAAGQCSLRAAVDESNELLGRDLINVPAGTYPGGLRIRDGVAIQGAGAEATVIDGADADRVLDVLSGEALVVDGNKIASIKITGEMNPPFVPAGASPVAFATDIIQVPSLESDLLVASFTQGVLRFDDEAGTYKGVHIPTTVPGVGSVTPGGLMHGFSGFNFDIFVSNFQTSGGVLRFATDGTFRGVFAPAGSGGLNFPGAMLGREFFQQGFSVLVVSTGTGSVLRFDATTGNFVGTLISGVSRPGDMIERNGVIYIASADNNAVFKFDAETGASLGTFVPNGSGGLAGPSIMQFGPDGDLYVQSRDNNRILRYDGTTGAFKKVFVQGGTPELAGVGAFFFLAQRFGNGGPFVQMSGVTLANGRANSGSGSGLSIFAGASMTFSHGSVRDSESQTNGGGINNSGELHLVNTSVTGNSIILGLTGGGVTSIGGGILTTGNLRLDGCLIAHNRASRGGGIDVEGKHGIAHIRNTTISNNSTLGSGAGIRVVGPAAAVIASSTITENRANDGGTDTVRRGGGIFLDATGLLNIGSSIVAANLDGREPGHVDYSPDCATAAPVILLSERSNLFGVINANCNAQDVFWGDLRFDQAGTASDKLPPGLEPLDDYGGPTLTHLLSSGSPAIDMGATGTDPVNFFDCPAFDQREQPRPLDGDGDGDFRCDVGAVEGREALANDLDGDGIDNAVDTDPQQFSFSFSDISPGSSTNGSIESYGEQLITISDLPGGGVSVSASPDGGATPAVISACNGEVTVEVEAGETTTITCVTANAGPDLTLECTGGAALATLNGSASSAAGGTPSFAWNAPGVTLQNSTQPIATGSFPLGTKTATLTVSRASLSATDSALVVVLDRTPPILNVPADVTAATCTSVSLGQATASDGCGGNVTIVNDAPAAFKAGAYTVTWRAIDRFGNEAVKTQKVSVGLGDNSACCPAGTNVIVGTSANNTLTGTAGADCILGKGGQDTLRGVGGNDFLSGGDGDDVLEGGDGNDFVEAGAGQDTLRGQNGNDTLLGMDGDDICYGGNNDDVIRGGPGQDRLFGESGNDTLFGDSGDDTLDGGAGDDALNGGGLHDQCIGGTGTNTFTLCQTQGP